MRAYKILFFLLFAALFAGAQEREPEVMRMGGRIRSMGESMRNNGGQDSLRHRNNSEDSITISYRYLNRSGPFKLDSSVSDYTLRFPLSSTSLNLGNFGSASRSVLFAPVQSVGFDAGFHAYESYGWKAEEARFFQTTRPYSEINYQLGSRIEQMISLLHTQQIKSNWNFMFQYRMINSPGIIQHQRSNHNNYLFTSHYQSSNLRYHIWMIALSNKLQSEENGGIVDTTDILNDPIYKDRFNIPVWLGGVDNFSSNFFSTKINTGTQYKQNAFIWRHQYDWGRKDSLVTDSTVLPLFFPRLRVEHQVTIEKDLYTFLDNRPAGVYYALNYDTILQRTDSLLLRDSWSKVSNDFSIYQFPDAKNLHQYFKLGVLFQLLRGHTRVSNPSFFNTAGHFIYKNLTRNKKWDMELRATLFFTGYNAGDYAASIHLQRVIGKKWSKLAVGADQVGSKPSFLFDQRSSFYWPHQSFHLNKSSNSKLFCEWDLPSHNLKLKGEYFLVGNYTYLKNYFQVHQESRLFTVMQLSLLKTFRMGKRWNWHVEFYWQQRVGSAELHLMPFYTRNRLAYEGNLGFKNLNIALGAELVYRPSYKADNYSPALGQFFYQDSLNLSSSLPDMAVYANFRIKPFTAFCRVENLNTARNLNGFGFTRNNWIAPGYPMNGMHIRIGIFWQFVN